MPKQSPETPAASIETILLVEDEKSLRDMVAKILSGYNFHVLRAGSGPEAVELWEKHKDEIAMLFTDVVMPRGLSGVEIAERFHNEKPALKVIYTSGYRLDIIPKVGKLKKYGVYVPKPYVPSAVAKIMRETLNS